MEPDGIATAAQEAELPTLVIKTLTDRAIVLELASYPTIRDVQLHLESRENIPLDAQLLISQGTVLHGDQTTASLPSLVVPSTKVPTTTIHLFYYEPAAHAYDPIETASDWDAKNRLKCFKGLFLLSRRDYAEAAPLLVDALTTFEQTSFIAYRDCVKYTVVAAMLAFDRPTLYRKVVKAPEVLEAIDETPHLTGLLQSLYSCNYKDFFLALAAIQDSFQLDWLLAGHREYIAKELRIRAYSQILQSYRSLSLSFMAAAFGVSADFIDRELSRFIAAGRLECVIDKVAGVVITNPPDTRNHQYLALIRQGDLLLNRIQKLAHVVSQ